MKANNKVRICLITGNDEAAIKNKASELFTEIKASLGDSIALDIIDAETDGAKDLQVLTYFLDALKAPSLLFEKKCIWLKSVSCLEDVFTSKKENEIKFVFNEIVNVLENEIKNPDLGLLISGFEISSKNSIYKLFETEKALHTINKITAGAKNSQIDIENRIKEYLAKQNKSVDGSALEFLSLSLGTESGKFFNELDKLISFCWDKKVITLSDCKVIISKTFEMAAWSFAEAFASKNKKEALLTLNILLDKNSTDSKVQTSELSLLFSLSKKINEIIKTKAALEVFKITKPMTYQQFQKLVADAPENEDTKFITSMHPYRAYKMFEQSQKFSEQSLCKIVSAILDANIELVSGSISKKMTLENLVMKCC